MRASGVAVEPPPTVSPGQHLVLSDHDELTTQLQGLHQLHIQLETAIALLEGREPHGVPLFEGEFEELFSNFQKFQDSNLPLAITTTTTAAGDDSPRSPQSNAEAQRQFSELMVQISEIQRDFGKLMQQKHQQEEDDSDGDSSNSSCGEAESIDEHRGRSPKDIQEGEEEISSSSLFSNSQNEESFSVTSVEEADDEEERNVYNESDKRSNSHHPNELKLLEYRTKSRTNDSEERSDSESISGNSSEDGAPEATKVGPGEDVEQKIKEDSSPSSSSATLRLQVLQSKRQLESRGKEIARLQGVVQSLESKMVSAAAPKAVMAQAAEIQKKCADMEIQLRNAELDASEANSQVVALQKAAKEREKEFANMKKPSDLAVEQWQQGKKLQKRIDFLQNKLQEKTKETETAIKTQEMLQKQVNRLTTELSQSQATTRSILSKLEKQELKNINGGPGGKNVPGTVVKKMMEEMEVLQQRHDALERQLASQGGKQLQQGNSLIYSAVSGSAVSVYSSYSAPVSPAINAGKAQIYCPSRYTDSSNGHATKSFNETEKYSSGNGGSADGNAAAGSVARDLKILDLEMERDQATARAARLQQRLNFVLEELGETSTSSSKLSPYQKQDRRRSSSNSATAASKQASSNNERENELLDTINLLKTALEKTRKGLENGVSSAKYMQAVEKAKLAAERVRELEIALKEASLHQERLTLAQKEVADAQVMISALRGQLRDAKRRGKENAAAREEIINAQIAELERALRERDAQLAALKHSACDEARALVAEGLTPKMVVHELLSARAELAAALEREEALKRELAPFDSVFFAELHQLKREHEELRMMCASYEPRRK